MQFDFKDKKRKWMVQAEDKSILDEWYASQKDKEKRIKDYRDLIGNDYVSLHLPDPIEADGYGYASTAQDLLDQQRSRLSILKSDFAFVASKEIPALPEGYSRYAAMESKIAAAKEQIKSDINKRIEELLQKKTIPKVQSDFLMHASSMAPWLAQRGYGVPSGAPWLAQRGYGVPSGAKWGVNALIDLLAELTPDRLDSLAFAKVMLTDPKIQGEGASAAAFAKVMLTYPKIQGEGASAAYRVRIRDMWRKNDASVKESLVNLRETHLRLRGETQAELSASARLHETSRQKMIASLEADIRRRQATLLANQGQTLRRTTGFGE